jgi:hypothetical protein
LFQQARIPASRHVDENVRVNQDGFQRNLFSRDPFRSARR